MGASPTQILIVLVLVLLLFGAGRLGDIGKGLGEGIKNFKKGLSDSDDDSPKQIPPTAKTDAKVVEEKEAKS